MIPAGRRASRAQQLFAEVRALAGPIAAYWGANVLGLSLFTAFLMANSAFDIGGFALFSSCWAATLGGAALGQLAALLRLRTGWIVVATSVVWSLGTAFTISTGVAGAAPLAVWMFIFLFLFPFFFACGYWSLATNTGLLSLFAPMVWFIGDILFIVEKSGAIEAWLGGDKWAIWNVFSATVLGGAVAACVLYLATREMHRLHRWRFSPAAAEMSSASPTQGRRAAGESIGCGGLVVLLLLGVVLTGATAAVSPYFWRTGESEQGETSTEPQPSEPEPEPQQQPSASDPMQQAERAAQEAAGALANLLIILLLTLAALLVFGPPLRRTLLLRHLRRPFWPVPPTRRVAQHWRLVEIALGDLGEPRRPGDTAATLVGRAAERAGFIDPDALHRCSEVADRVQYGLGLRPDDAMMARRTAEMTYQTVWDELSEWQKLRAMYRWL
jgi:hypothetical protein